MPSIFQVRDHLFKSLFLDAGRALNRPPTLLHESFAKFEDGLPAALPVFQGLAIGGREETPDEIFLFTTWDPKTINLDRILRAVDVSRDEFSPRVIRTGIFVSATRPAMGGDSVSLGQKSTGTIGARVRESSGSYSLLSCNHVIADLNAGIKGKEEVWAPGDKAGGTSRDRLGVLKDFSPIVFGDTVPNRIDAATAEPDRSSDLEKGIRGLGPLAPPNTNPKLNLLVTKVGWSTGKTTGKMRFWNLGFLNLFPNGSTALFEGQYGIVGMGKGYFAQRGDSGSVVVDDTNAPVGLLFSVASGIDLAIMNPIDEVLKYFNIEFA